MLDDLSPRALIRTPELHTPQHKGKVERGVAYAKNNALKGRQFASLADQNAHLLHWEEQVADKRVHGTTRRQVAAVFEEERKALGPLPAPLYAVYQEGRRRVQRDSFRVISGDCGIPGDFAAEPADITRLIWQLAAAAGDPHDPTQQPYFTKLVTFDFFHYMSAVHPGKWLDQRRTLFRQYLAGHVPEAPAGCADGLSR